MILTIQVHLLRKGEVLKSSRLHAFAYLDDEGDYSKTARAIAYVEEIAEKIAEKLAQEMAEEEGQSASRADCATKDSENTKGT